VSDDFNSDRSAVFFGDECFSDRIGLVALGGEISPVFASGQELTIPTDYSPVITEAEGNVIRRVDGMPFGEYLRKFNIDASVLEDFPISLIVHSPDEGARDSVTALVKLEEDQSGVFANSVNVGESISLCCITRGNIERSTRACLDSLAAEMRERATEGYRFDMVFAVSCIARYCVTPQDRHVEADALAAAFPEDMGTFGMFAFAEYCPVPGADGKRENARHGQTLAMCAF
jgi:hypothetical protein